jgi:hypothetical protein
MRQGLAPPARGVLMIIDLDGDENISSDVSSLRLCLLGELVVRGCCAMVLRGDDALLSLKERASGSGLES